MQHHRARDERPRRRARRRARGERASLRRRRPRVPSRVSSRWPVGRTRRRARLRRVEGRPRDVAPPHARPRRARRRRCVDGGADRSLSGLGGRCRARRRVRRRGRSACRRPAPASSSAFDVDEPEVVEFAFDDVEIGSAPDIDARKARAEDLKRQGLTELEAKAIENNQKIKQYNNAPAEFPTFVREGYDVKLITSPGFVTQDDGLVYKDFEGAGPTPRMDGR